MDILKALLGLSGGDLLQTEMGQLVVKIDSEMRSNKQSYYDLKPSDSDAFKALKNQHRCLIPWEARFERIRSP